MNSIHTFIFIVLAWPSMLVAESIQVPEHHRSIQAAINAVEFGDTIEVAVGTYDERIVLTVLKEGLADVTVSGFFGNDWSAETPDFIWKSE